MTGLLAVNSMLMNQKYIVNKMCLNRNARKTRFYIDLLMEILWPKVRWNPALYFPEERGSVFVNSVFAVTF